MMGLALSSSWRYSSSAAQHVSTVHTATSFVRIPQTAEFCCAREWVWVGEKLDKKGRFMTGLAPDGRTDNNQQQMVGSGHFICNIWFVHLPQPLGQAYLTLLLLHISFFSHSSSWSPSQHWPVSVRTDQEQTSLLSVWKKKKPRVDHLLTQMMTR